MVDRLEELLALLEDEDDQDEWEDALELRAAAVPAAPVSEIETEEAPQDGVEKAAAALKEEETASVEAEALSWLPDGGAVVPEGQEEAPGSGGGADGGMVEDDAVRNGAAELWWDELAAPVMGPNGSVALRKPGAGDVDLAELAGPLRQTGAAELDAVMESMTEADQGLEELYKQTVRAGRPAAQNLPVEQAGRSARAQEPGRTAAVTVDELDRAVRRDSRRYDGGMVLF